jgi:hypothetical protein
VGGCDSRGDEDCVVEEAGLMMEGCDVSVIGVVAADSSILGMPLTLGFSDRVPDWLLDSRNAVYD